MSNRFVDFFRRDRKLRRWLRLLETLSQQRGPSRVMRAIEESFQVIMTVCVVLVIATWLFVVIIGPMFPASQASFAKSDTAANLAAVALWNALPGHAARVDRRFGDNLNLYVNRKVFEDIPYPDRNDVVEKIRRAWCDNIEYPWLPRVSIYDIRSGKRLSTYVCAVGKLKEAFSKSSSRTTSKQKPPTDSSPAQGAKTNDEMDHERAAVIKKIKETRAGAEKLLSLHEAERTRLLQQYEQRREQYYKGAISRNDVLQAEHALAQAMLLVDEDKRWLAETDMAITEYFARDEALRRR